MSVIEQNRISCRSDRLTEYFQQPNNDRAGYDEERWIAGAAGSGGGGLTSW